MTRHTPAPAREALRGRVLVAEDNPVNQEMMLCMLEALGLSADVAADGNEALGAVERVAYDLVLMDCQMPNKDGIQATIELRAREAARGDRRVPIIALTAHAMGGDRERCLAAGMDEYLTKPIMQGVLRQALARWLPAAAPAPPSAGAVTSPAPVASPASAAAGSGPAESAEPIDFAILNQMRGIEHGGGPTLFHRAIDLFLEHSPEAVDAMRAALQQGDPQAAARAAHSLKSSSGFLGARRLSDLCRRMESAASAGDLPQTAALVADVEREYQKVRVALQAAREGAA